MLSRTISLREAQDVDDFGLSDTPRADHEEATNIRPNLLPVKLPVGVTIDDPHGRGTRVRDLLTLGERAVIGILELRMNHVDPCLCHVVTFVRKVAAHVLERALKEPVFAGRKPAITDTKVGLPKSLGVVHGYARRLN